MIAGRLHWRDGKPKAAAKRSARSRTLASFEFSNGTLSLTEAGTQRRASLHVIAGADALNALDPGGEEVFDLSPEHFAEILQSANHTLKRALTDPRLFSGIGNAYSDEILFAAQLSPLALTQKLNPAQIRQLYDATRDQLQLWITRLREETGSAFPEKGHRLPPLDGRPRPLPATVRALRHENSAHPLRVERDQLLPTMPDRRKAPRRPLALAPVAQRLASHGRGTGKSQVTTENELIKRLPNPGGLQNPPRQALKRKRIPGRICSCLVPKKGLEPPHPCGYMDLNHARLPIPPLRPVVAPRANPGGSTMRSQTSIFLRSRAPVKLRRIQLLAADLPRQSCLTLNRTLGRTIAALATAKATERIMSTPSRLPATVQTSLRTLAHDLSNSLETIMQASYLLGQSSLGGEQHKWVELIENAAQDAAQLNRELANAAILARRSGNPDRYATTPLSSIKKTPHSPARVIPDIGRRETGLRFQLRRHRDLRIQHLRNWAAFLSRLRILLKRCRVRSRNFSHHVQMALRNCPPGIQLFHGQRHVCIDAGRSQIRRSQLRRKRHREARRVRRRNQLFRVRPRSILKSRLERILRIVQHPARCGDAIPSHPSDFHSKLHSLFSASGFLVSIKWLFELPPDCSPSALYRASAHSPLRSRARRTSSSQPYGFDFLESLQLGCDPTVNFGGLVDSMRWPASDSRCAQAA